MKPIIPAILVASLAIGSVSADETASSTVTDDLQGKDGVRIQTMCTHCNSANIQVGGLNQDLVPIYIAGYPILGGLAVSMVFNVLPADDIADTQVSKGPGEAVEPAAAAGGTIRLTEAKPEELPWLDLALEGGSFGLRNASLRAAGPMAPWLSGSVVFGITEADPIDDDRDGWNDVGSLDREYAKARLLVDAGRNHRIDLGGTYIADDTLEARGAFDVLAYSFGGTGDPAWTREDTLLDRTEYRAGWEWKIPSGGRLAVRGLKAERDQSVLSQMTVLDVGSFNEIFERFRIREENDWAAATWSGALGLSAMLEAGIETDDQEVGALTLDPVEPPTSGTDYVQRRSAHADLDWTVHPKLALQLGLRYDDFAWGARELGIEKEDQVTSPRATLQFLPSPAWTFRLIAGKTARAPKPIFTEVCCGQKYQRSYTSDLETGTTFGLESEYQPSPDLRISLYAARTDFDDYLIKVAGWSQFYIQTYTLGNIPEARAETLEMAFNWSANRRVAFDGSIGWLTFMNTGDPDVVFQVTPPSFASPQDQIVPIDRVPYQPVRTGSCGMNFSLPRGISIAAGGSYTGRMPIQQYNQDPTAAQNILLPEMRSSGDFWMVNLSFRAPIGKHLTLEGGVANLTNKLQTDLGDPTTDYNWGPLNGKSYRLGLRYHLDR